MTYFFIYVVLMSMILWAEVGCRSGLSAVQGHSWRFLVLGRLWMERELHFRFLSCCHTALRLWCGLCGQTDRQWMRRFQCFVFSKPLWSLMLIFLLFCDVFQQSSDHVLNWPDERKRSKWRPSHYSVSSSSYTGIVLMPRHLHWDLTATRFLRTWILV